MLIETTKQLTNYEGEPWVIDGRPFTARDAIFIALNTYAGNYTPSTQEKADAFRLTALVYAGPTAEMVLEDATLIKVASGRSTASPLVHGRLCELLENAAQIPAASDNGKADHPVEADQLA